MKKVTHKDMIFGVWYYIDSTNTKKYSGSGRQIGCFDHFYGNVVVFSQITDIRRSDGTTGRSGMAINGGGSRHIKYFRFYLPMEELIMRRALVRRIICRTRQIACDAEEFIVAL